MWGQTYLVLSHGPIMGLRPLLRRILDSDGRLLINTVLDSKELVVEPAVKRLDPKPTVAVERVNMPDPGQPQLPFDSVLAQRITTSGRS